MNVSTSWWSWTLIFKLHLVSICACTCLWARACHDTHAEARRQLVEVSSLPPLQATQELNSGDHVWQQAPAWSANLPAN